ncbi:MAG: LamG domain-containing protein, partial [Nitrospira sp.]|nr:LamG domain-containing protein [Nitrospira sp.]
MAAVAFTVLASAATAHAALKDGIVAYWPLDSVVGTKTPDLVSGYDMELSNLTEADLVDGKRGKAFKFENARQTMLRRVNAPGEQLPINQYPAFTITFWANVTGTGLTDLRLFSEGSTSNNDPLFNLGTDSTGATGSLDVFLRRSGWTTVNHIKTEGQPLDGTWHHITFVQSEDGTRALYLDGVKDSLEIPAKEAGDWSVNTTTLGGILRANPTHWLTGLMDDVALWNRALSETEITQVVNEGLVSVFPPAAVGMVAYWPLDEIIGVKTPDLVNGYDMELANLTSADLVDGKRGKAFKFENARQTLLKRVHTAGELLPINQYPAFTISFWANVQGTGLTDLRLFSEGSTSNNNPLFNLGTASTGASGQLDLFIRKDPWPTVDHLKTTTEPLDGTWRHILFVQQADGARAVYIDGVKDELEIPAKPEGSWVVNTTTIGGILRANPTHWLTGMMDDVALWNRALSEAEITSVFKDGTPVPFTKPQPLAIRSFTADLPAVAVGDKVILRWDVTKNVQVAIDSGVGDVTAQTVSGLGSVEVALTQSKNFKLTLTRGTETLSATVAAAAIPDVATGWTLIDNFDRYTEGNLNGKGEWKDLTPTGFSIVNLDGNPMLAPNGGDVGAVLPLRSLIINEGQKRTLFFRVYARGDEAESLRGEIVLTDRRIRFGSDVNNGPGARISDEQDELVRLGNANGYQAPLELFDPPLDPMTAYNVWVDVDNGPLS